MAGLEPSWQNDVALATLQPAPVFPELYQELWWSSGSSVAFNGQTTGGSNGLFKGTTNTSPYSGSATHLYTHNWPSSTQCAIECSMYCNNASYIAYAQLWDFTSGAVAGVAINTSSTSMTVLRSNKFTLTQGHSYGITLYMNNASTPAGYITDASLIIFPSSPLTSPSVSAISLANPSGNTLKEAYIPLWVYSSGSVGVTGGSAGGSFLQKGSTSVITGAPSSTGKLYTLSSAWSQSQKFAFECSIEVPQAGYTAYAGLYDATTSTVVSTSQVSTTSNTMTLLRSNSFKLTPSHAYAVYLYSSSASATSYLTKAHLVALAQ